MYITSQKINYGQMTACYPTTFHTHDSGKTLDYILASSDEVLHNLPPIAPPGAIVVPPMPGQAFQGETWVMGEAKSDHKLVCYKQDNGPNSSGGEYRSFIGLAYGEWQGLEKV